MKRFVEIFFAVSVVIFFSGCRNNSSEGLQDAAESNSEIIIDSNQALVYTVPTPLQVTSALKMLNIKYSDKIIGDFTKGHKEAQTSANKAVILGMNLVDLAYVVTYDNKQASLNYFSNVEALSRELDLQNQKTIPILAKCKNNLNNKDSLFRTLLTLQNEVDRKLFESQQEEVSILILVGFYIEGMHVLTSYYQQLYKSNNLHAFYTRNLNNLVLQQKIYLESLVDLLKMYKGHEYKALSEKLSDLKTQFDKLNIKYEYSDKEKRLKNVVIDNKVLFEISASVKSLRNSIFTGTLK